MSVDVFTRSLAELCSPPEDGWEPYPWQISPPAIPVQGTWLIVGGRGIGKTDGCAHYVDEHVRGPACDPRVPGGHRIAIIAPTLGDAVESCVRGPSGLMQYNANVRLREGGVGGSLVRWPSGAEARLFGAFTPQDVERLRAGGNRCLVWLEEAAAMRQLGAAVKQARYGLRLGSRSHFIGSSTPKPTVDFRELMGSKDTAVTHGRTADAHHLDQAVRDALERDYAGTRLGRQELDGEMLDDVEGALWTLGQLDGLRVASAPDLVRVVVAVDPSGGDTESHDEQGIIVAGRSSEGEYFVIADRSCRESPHGWGSRAVAAYDEFAADRIVAENNYGGQMVEHTIRTVRPDVPVTSLVASRGKRQRAEPVAALYEQGRVHHVGPFPSLEDQMASWVPESGRSPDRMDALVWAITELQTLPSRGPRMRFNAA